MTQLQSLRDAPGTSREYETIFILTPDTPNDGVAKLNDRVKAIVESMGGSILKVDNWGKRRLAYEVDKQLKGIYLYWQYLGTSGLVEELERNLRMVDTVIRYMTVKLDADIDPTARPTEMDDDAYARAAETAADEEDLMMGHGSAGASEDGEEGEEGEEGDEAVKASADGDEAVEASADGEEAVEASADSDDTSSDEGDSAVKADADADKTADEAADEEEK